MSISTSFSPLAPGEKLFEELFDPSEVQSDVTTDGYVVASPRVIDRAAPRKVAFRTRAGGAQRGREARVELLLHIVPEYSGAIMPRKRSRKRTCKGEGKVEPILQAD